VPWRKRAKKGMGVASAYLSMSAALSVETGGGDCWMVESILTSGEIVAFVLLGGGRSKEVTLSPIGRRLARRSTMVYSSCPQRYLFCFDLFCFEFSVFVQKMTV